MNCLEVIDSEFMCDICDTFCPVSKKTGSDVDICPSDNTDTPPSNNDFDFIDVEGHRLPFCKTSSQTIRIDAKYEVGSSYGVQVMEINEK